MNSIKKQNTGEYIKPEKSFHPQAKHPGPRFPAGLCPLLFPVS
jgi:hypothetical protein